MPDQAGRKALFIVGEPQEEALARIDYLRARGGGWCDISGPQGIGKSSLLSELSRRAQQRGEDRAWLDLGPVSHFDWFAALAEAWRIDVVRADSALEVRQRLEDRLSGWRAMNKPAWLFIDEANGFSKDLARGCRWLREFTRRLDCPLLVITAGCLAGDSPAASDDADLKLELWPWESHDCETYVRASCRDANRPISFSPTAIGALCERSAGIPRDVAKLVSWSLAAADAEALTDIGPELIHAVADELTPREPFRANYEVSAAYGAW